MTLLNHNDFKRDALKFSKVDLRIFHHIFQFQVQIQF